MSEKRGILMGREFTPVNQVKKGLDNIYNEAKKTGVSEKSLEGVKKDVFEEYHQTIKKLQKDLEQKNLPKELKSQALLQAIERINAQVENEKEKVDENLTPELMTNAGAEKNFEKRLEKINEGDKIVLIAFDLDDFKSVNDNHGHLEGNLVISSVGKALHKLLRNHDVGIRFSGDEFGVLMTVTQGETERVDEFVKRIISEIEDNVKRPDNAIQRVSAGYEILDEEILGEDTPKKSFELLRKHADDSSEKSKLLKIQNTLNGYPISGSQRVLPYSESKTAIDPEQEDRLKFIRASMRSLRGVGNLKKISEAGLMRIADEMYQSINEEKK